jgi:hypothetical protein
MADIFELSALSATTLIPLGSLQFYLVAQIGRYSNVGDLIASLYCLITFQLGCYLFVYSPNSVENERLAVLAVALIPLALIPVNFTIGHAGFEHRSSTRSRIIRSKALSRVNCELLAGGLVQSVSGMLGHPKS